MTVQRKEDSVEGPKDIFKKEKEFRERENVFLGARVIFGGLDGMLNK